MTFRVAILITSYGVKLVYDYFIPGFPKVGQVAPLEAKGSRGVRGAMSSKRATGGPLGNNLNLTLSWVADVEQKRKVLSVFCGSLWVIVLKGAIDFLAS